MCVLSTAMNLNFSSSSQYGFKNIFTEDKDTEIRPLPRKVFEYIFTCVKRACYQFLVFTIGFLLMFVYGLLFAVYSFSVAWIMNPILRSCLLFLGPCIKLPMQIMVMACAPCTDHLVKAIQKICPQRWYREER